MPPKKGWRKGDDGKYYPPPKTEESSTTSIQIISAEEQRKLEPAKGTDTSKFPRITITQLDDKGRLRSVTYVCDPQTLRIERNEINGFTSAGKPKTSMTLAIDGKVMEIE